MTWNYSIELNKVISDCNSNYQLDQMDFEDDCPEEIKQLISEEVKKAKPLAKYSGKILDVVTIHDLNCLLEEIFDEADRRRVFCGIPF